MYPIQIFLVVCLLLMESPRNNVNIVVPLHYGNRFNESCGQKMLLILLLLHTMTVSILFVFLQSRLYLFNDYCRCHDDGLKEMQQFK